MEHAIRKYFEELEHEILAPYALKSNQSQGRKYKEAPDPYRTCFQRDRDRILHSKAFRRLKQKTQVIGVFSGDHYRTRLTHSLEVSQIARQVARMLRLNEDVVESISLAHDLGHTPFGHVGEQALNDLMADEGGFEHNEQSRRVLEYLEQRYPGFPGLNLSYEILDGMIKHRTPYDKVRIDDTHSFIFSLEAQVVNLADEIAYNNHDLDDGIYSGILSMDELLENVQLWREATQAIKKKYSSISDNELHRLSISFLIGYQVLDVFEQTRFYLEDKQINSINGVKSNPNLACFSKEMQEKNRELRSYLFKNFYKHPKIEIINSKGVYIIRELFTYYLNNPDRLPSGSNKFLQKDNLKRKIADYIASMTDNFAEQTYNTLTGDS